MKRTLLVAILAGLGLTGANAGIMSLPAVKHYPHENYYAGEGTFDLISVYVVPQLDEGVDYSLDEDALEKGFGGGVAASYFYTENFGIAVRAYWWDTATSLTSLTGSVVYRYPIDDSGFAPYMFAGAGAHFASEADHGSFHAGIGIEYRFTDTLGLIADYTYTWGEHDANWAMYSLGLRVKF